MQLEFELTSDGKTFGVQIDESLQIIAIAEDGAAKGKLMSLYYILIYHTQQLTSSVTEFYALICIPFQVGDVVLAVNDIPISSLSHLENTINSAGSSIKVRISRADGNMNDAGNGDLDTPVTVSCLYIFITEVTLKYTAASKQKLGLGVCIENGEIYVSKVMAGSIADDLLHEGDIINEIDGVKPTSKENTRNLLISALKKNGKAVLKVRCIMSPEQKNDEPSVMMNSDVLEIAQRQKERLLNTKQESKPAVRGILGRYTGPSEQREQKRLNVEADHQSLMIGMDPVDHPLVHVKQDPNQGDDAQSE
ncbi:unnamed protein product [Toxocara canis]|uniref:PDZ domain-containing protein n=1 Tax=Toxocara canis TaxID=6265 RepID=A0A183UR54_TOXCA|nr:unnamed protein product [Toxocara canis]